MSGVESTEAISSTGFTDKLTGKLPLARFRPKLLDCLKDYTPELLAKLAAASGAAGAASRTWRAYLSTNGGPGEIHARDRIGKGPWKNARGVVIAESVEQLHGENNLNKQTALIDPERQGVKDLWDKGLVTISRRNQLERTSERQETSDRDPKAPLLARPSIPHL